MVDSLPCSHTVGPHIWGSHSPLPHENLKETLKVHTVLFWDFKISPEKNLFFTNTAPTTTATTKKHITTAVSTTITDSKISIQNSYQTFKTYVLR